MAPKVVVPADFGVENLHCEFHGNVVIKLQGGEDMRANSLILSYHSSVFVRLFWELHQSVVEMDDFSKEAVKSFLEALYSGEIQLDRQLFRDVNKMCHVFKVDWLSRRCGEYFAGLVGDVRPSTDYQNLLFLFEEARFSLKVIKCDKMLDIVVQKICSLENRAEIFVEPYMKNYRELGASQLDLLLKITKSNPVSLLKIMKNKLEREENEFDNVSRHILENVDLLKCICDDEPFFEMLFDFLEKVTQSCDSDTSFVNKLYRKSTREFKKINQVVSSTNVCNSSISTDPQPPALTSLPHIFCSFESFRELPLKECFERLKVSPHVVNLYMFIEGLLVKDFIDVLTPEMVLEIEETRRKRSWSRICSDFLTFCHPVDETVVKIIISNSSDLLAAPGEESVRRVGRIIGSDNRISKSNSFALRTFFLSPTAFAFYFKHPRTSSCNSAGKCGFMLKFKPEMKLSQPYKFRVNLCVDQEEYPNGLHYHAEVKAEKIHLVLVQSLQGDVTYFHATITWNELGVSKSLLDEDSCVRWNVGTSSIDPSTHFKVMAFVTL